jgi:type VI secretion system protein ImpB
VQITYDVEIGSAIEKKELPFVAGVVSDLSGHRSEELQKLRDRRFVDIDRDNFSNVMESITPRLELSVKDAMKEDENLKLELSFSDMSDFTPERLVNQIPRLEKLLDARNDLRDLLAKLDGNDDLDSVLEEIVSNTEELKKVQKESAEANNGDDEGDED